MTSGTTHRIPGTLPPQATGFVGRQARSPRSSAALMESQAGHHRRRRRGRQDPGRGAGRRADVGPLPRRRAPGRAVGRARSPLLASTVAASLGLPAQDARPQLAAVLDYLRERALLLILDTCEHLVDACAALAAEVLREAPARHPAGDQQAAARRARREHLPAAPAARSRGRRRGVRIPTRSRCSPSAPRPSSTGSRSPARTAPTSSGSAGRSTASRWRSSSPRSGCGRCRSTRWPAASTTASTCSPAASGPGWRGTRRSAPRSNGATTSARRPSRWCGRGCRSSRGPSTSPRRKRCARTTS